jgi:RNA polymerase sigma factor (sigma-70 family)
MSDRTDDPAGRSDAISSLYHRYSHWFRARVVKRYGIQDADDLVQETWLRMTPYQAANEVRHPKAVLLRIASNLVAERHTRRTRRGRVVEEVSHLGGWAVEKPAQADELLAKQIVLGLPQPLRDVFVLSRVGGLTNVQIAETLGISLKTVEKRMTKALAHCAAQLRL